MKKNKRRDNISVTFRISEKDKGVANIKLDTNGKLSVIQMINYLSFCSNILMRNLIYSRSRFNEDPDVYELKNLMLTKINSQIDEAIKEYFDNKE